MRIVAVSTSSRKGEKKINQPQVTLVANHGVEGDVHADGSHRQLSLLAMEDIEYMRSMGADVHPGDFAENITTEGVELYTCPIGTRFIRPALLTRMSTGPTSALIFATIALTASSSETSAA